MARIDIYLYTTYACFDLDVYITLECVFYLDFTKQSLFQNTICILKSILLVQLTCVCIFFLPVIIACGEINLDITITIHIC